MASELFSLPNTRTSLKNLIIKKTQSWNEEKLMSRNSSEQKNTNMTTVSWFAVHIPPRCAKPRFSDYFKSDYLPVGCVWCSEINWSFWDISRQLDTAVKISNVLVLSYKSLFSRTSGQMSSLKKKAPFSSCWTFPQHPVFFKGVNCSNPATTCDRLAALCNYILFLLLSPLATIYYSSTALRPNVKVVLLLKPTTVLLYVVNARIIPYLYENTP